MVKKTEEKTANVAYAYKIAINRLSRHYSENTGINTNIYSIKNLAVLQNIENDYTDGRFNSYGKESSGVNRAAISAYLRFFRSLDISKIIFEGISENNEDTEDNPVFTLERDLQKSLELQVDELFPEYNIFGEKNEGTQYNINGKKIDLLLKHNSENELLVIELKAGRADFKAFGQISMYMGPLMQEFPNYNISGLIIAEEIDDSLKSACLTNDKVKLKKYQIKLKLEDI